MAVDDEPLVAAAQRGEMAAFNQLVERYQGLVFNVCARMLSNPQAAEDATQETFFAAYRAIKGFRGSSFRGWLLRIATNQCYDQLRRSVRTQQSDLDDDLPIADPDPLPADTAVGVETLVAVERAIRQLPEEQRLCVVLVDVQGLDYNEAAEAMNVNLGTVKSRLSRARGRLRELLGPQVRLEEGE